MLKVLKFASARKNKKNVFALIFLGLGDYSLSIRFTASRKSAVSVVLTSTQRSVPGRIRTCIGFYSVGPPMMREKNRTYNGWFFESCSLVFLAALQENLKLFC